MEIVTRLNGLKVGEVEEGRRRWGANVWMEPKRVSAGHMIWSQFQSPLIGFLLLAAIVSFWLRDYPDAVVIGLTVTLNTLLGFIQEYKAERDLEALSGILKPLATVVREGQRVEVSISDLVPGDIVLMDAGSTVPADGVLVESQQMGVSEALLTGEAEVVAKTGLNGVVKLGGEVRLAPLRFKGLTNRREAEGGASIYAGTAVVMGSGMMVVVRTGVATELGQMAQLIARTDERPTPLQRRLAKMSNQLALIFGLVGVGVFGFGWLMRQPVMELLRVSVALVVAAMPEGLVISVTMVLAVSMRRILRQKALVRKLVAAEVLGSVNMICSDKTGTLTEGMMRVEKTEWVDERRGLRAVYLATDFKDPMEMVLHAYTKEKLKAYQGALVDKRAERLDRWAFDSQRRYSATLTQEEVEIVGAPEMVLGQCRLTQVAWRKWETSSRQLMDQGYRVVAVAWAKRQGEEKITREMLGRQWHLLGLVALSDPVRVGLSKMVAQAARAGIGLKVITGDAMETALAVLKRLNIEVKETEVIEGDQLHDMSEAMLDECIKATVLFARITPQQKLKIIESLQRTGAVVAMTGDGVNDAPALKKADIGIVVSTASDVSKETADMVLLDDNLGTIIAAVDEGRNVFRTVQKVVLYLLSDSLAEVLVVVGSLFLGWPLPLTALQILWVNLVNDGLPTIALTLEPKARGLLTEKPRSPAAGLITPFMAWTIACVSGVGGLGVLLIFGQYLARGATLAQAQTVAFTFLAVGSLWYVLSTRALERPMWQSRVFKNPWLILAILIGFGAQLMAVYAPLFQQMLGTVPLRWVDWGIIGVMGLLLLGLIEGLKLVFLRVAWRE